MIRVTRRYQFSASHRLHAPSLGDAENRDLYGKCNNPYGHGHNYELEVSVSGPIDSRSGRAVDLRQLDSLVMRQIVDRFDRSNLNEQFEAFRAEVPTSENLGREVVRILKQNWKAAFPAGTPVLDKVRIAETARNMFEVSSHEID